MLYKPFLFCATATSLFLPSESVAQKSQPSPIFAYLESKQYAPAPTHDSRWVAGGLIKVNWKTGIFEYVKPLGAFKSLPLSSPPSNLIGISMHTLSGRGLPHRR